MTDKYSHLVSLLRGYAGDTVNFSFDQFDRLMGGMPASARTNRTWWGNSRQAPWVPAGWIVSAIDLRRETVTFTRGTPTTRSARADPRMDGAAQLLAVLKRAGYESTLAAVAAHVVMLHPATVAQTNGQSVFAAVRRNPTLGEQVGTFGTLDGRPVMFDDNLSAIAAFTWASGVNRGIDMQFNHIWAASRDCQSYTALWNLCATPAFLAKTTDGSNHSEVIAALRYRVFELYGRVPAGLPKPVAPEGYEGVRWAEPLPPADDLEARLRRAMSTKPRDRVVRSAREIGWLFSGWQPDASLPH